MKLYAIVMPILLILTIALIGYELTPREYQYAHYVYETDDYVDEYSGIMRLVATQEELSIYCKGNVVAVLSWVNYTTLKDEEYFYTLKGYGTDTVVIERIVFNDQFMENYTLIRKIN